MLISSYFSDELQRLYPVIITFITIFLLTFLFDVFLHNDNLNFFTVLL